MGKTICFVNNKGGVGKTTTVCVVGRAWARLGRKILFIDLDSQANLTSIMTNTDAATQEWKMTLEDAFIAGPVEELPIINIAENMDIVPSDLSLANFDRESSRMISREHLLADLLATVKDSYDYILIDCPPALGLITYNALIASDYMVMVTCADGLSYMGMNMVAKMYDEVVRSNRLNPDLQIKGIFVTRFENNNLCNLYLEKFKAEVGPYLIFPVIRKSTKIAQAASFHRSIFDIDPQGRATQDYLRAAHELIERIELE